MATIAGTITYSPTVYITAASSGDATSIAGGFNGRVIGAVSTTTAAAATANSTAVTITWPALNVRAADGVILNAILSIIAGMTALTSPVTNVYCRTEGKVS